MTITGKWRIVEMEVWGREAVDLLGPASIEFDEQQGRFAFIAVQAWLDCRHGERDGRPLVEFSWDGQDDGEPTSGRGWAAVEADGTLRGRVFFHMGDDSAFTARPFCADDRPPRRARARARR
jgi:hypothetical protein